LHFLRRFSKAAYSNSKIHKLSRYLIELSLLNRKMLWYLPSVIAASAVYIARKMSKRTPVWTKTLKHYTKYDVKDIAPCVKEMNAFLIGIQAVKLSIKSKYSCSELLGVALIPPLLDIGV